MILKISKCFAFRLQVNETWFARVITPLHETKLETAFQTF